MIRLLDHGGKGYVSLEEFLEFYLEGRIVDENEESLSEGFLGKEAWRSAIEDNYELLEKLQDK